MLHNVLVRQLPFDAGAGRRRDSRRPGSRRTVGPRRSRSGSGWPCARRSRRSGRRTRPRAMTAATDPTRRLDPGRPARAGQAQPDARGRRAPTRRVPRPALGVRAARARRSPEPRAGRRAARHACTSTGLRPGPARRTTSSCARSRRPGRRSAAAGRRSRPGAGARGPPREADPGGGRPGRRLVATRPRRSTARSRRGARRSTPDARAHVAAGIGSDVPFFAVGGPALIEGRGERVAPLSGLRGHPAVLLVTPGVAARPRATSSRPSTRLRGSGDGSVRMSSSHLAEELRSGLSTPDLVARAGVLAMANDLLPAAVAVLPVARAVPPSAEPPPRRGRSGCPARARRSGRSMLPRPRPRRPPPTSGPPWRTARSSPRATRRRSSPPRPSSRTEAKGSQRHDAIGHLDQRRPGRDRPLQPGDLRRGLRLLRGPGRDRPGDRRRAHRPDRGRDAADPAQRRRHPRRGGRRLRGRRQDRRSSSPTSATSRR